MVRTKTILAAGILAAVGAVALAGAQSMPKQGSWNGTQMGPAMMGGGPGPQDASGWGMGWGGHGAGMCSGMAGRVQGRLAHLKAELKITPEQERLWQAYADAMNDSAQAMSGRCAVMMDRAGRTALALPDRLDQREEFIAAQLDALRDVDKALKPLYAALDQSQKQVADHAFWGPMGMM